MRTLEARLCKLEEKKGWTEPMVIIMDIVGDLEKPLLGYESGEWGEEPTITLRKEGESDEDLLERAKATAKSTGGRLTLRTIRVLPWEYQPGVP